MKVSNNNEGGGLCDIRPSNRNSRIIRMMRAIIRRRIKTLFDGNCSSNKLAVAVIDCAVGDWLNNFSVAREARSFLCSDMGICAVPFGVEPDSVRSVINGVVTAKFSVVEKKVVVVK